jgi:carboxypeptidase C (cathepsin A)
MRSAAAAERSMRYFSRLRLRTRASPGAASLAAAAAVCLLLIATLAPVGAGAEDKPHGGAGAGAALPARAETRHTITLAGHPLDYRAVAETIGLTNQKGEPTASIFVVSYLADAANSPSGGGSSGKRPIAFVFNGGPGAAAVFLHLGALGPRILDTPPTGAVPEPPINLVDNPSTWLAFTDLAFIDPVGTGFSRGEGKEDNPDKPFWNVGGDLDSLGAVVRRWLDRHDRWGAPVFLVGESYGGLRAAALAHRLAQDVGVAVSGLVLVSPALDVAALRPDISNELAPAFELPSEAASAAVFSGKSPGEAGAAAERFALSDYLVELTGLSGIPMPRDPFIARVAAVTGLPEWVVRRERGRVSGQDFVHELRRDQGEILSVYDATVARPTGANPWEDRAGDPILGPAVAAFTTAFENYAANELGYRTELPYRVLDGEVSRQWNWDGARGGERGLGLALTSLQQTLLARPATKLLIVNGRYDLVTPYLGSRWLIDQLAVPGTLRADIRLRVYEGGHMMYMRPQSRAALSADAAALFATATAGIASPTPQQQ